MIIPIIVLLLVLILIAVRQFGSFKLQIWHIMVGGAAVVLVTGQISASEAFHAINFDVIIFLFGMFIVGRALEESGLLSYWSYHYFKRAKNVNTLMFFIIFGAGMASAILMNDTVAIIGTPVVLLLAQKHRMSPKMLLLALAFAITVGSAMSPIGNPQNLLIAMSGMHNPFLEFTKLVLPTIINLFVIFFVIKFFYKDHFHNGILNHEEEQVKDAKLARICMISIIIIFVAIITKIVLIFLRSDTSLPLTLIAIVGATPILFFSQQRWHIVKEIDWPTLAFFAAMFVLMESVWSTGAIQGVINSLGIDVTSTPAIMVIGVLASQLISNVPLVALYLPLLSNATTTELLALAAGSTVAGNFLLFGAASNIIIVQNAEERGETLTFWEFARIGIPLTLLNVAIYVIFLIN